MNDELKTRNFAPPERMIFLCNKALDVIASLVKSDELYSSLSKEVCMTDEEIRQAGFDCVPVEDFKRFMVTATSAVTGNQITGFPIFNRSTGEFYVYTDECKNEKALPIGIEPVALAVIDPETDPQCPNCGVAFVCNTNGDMPDYCPTCGQKLKWSMPDE